MKLNNYVLVYGVYKTTRIFLVEKGIKSTRILVGVVWFKQCCSFSYVLLKNVGISEIDSQSFCLYTVFRNLASPCLAQMGSAYPINFHPDVYTIFRAVSSFTYFRLRDTFYLVLPFLMINFFF